MPPKSKMTTKQCPDCDQPCAVASKTCSCGFSFYNARKSDGLPGTSNTTSPTTTEPEDGNGIRQRRTQRVKEKPNYYDATEFIKVKRKRRRNRNDDQYELRRGVPEPPGPPGGGGPGGLKRKRKRKGRGEAKEREEEEEILMPIGSSPEKTAQCAVILAELNRRMNSAAVRVK